MRLSSQDRVRVTVAYADIFDYPLTKEEIHFWGIGGGVKTWHNDRALETVSTRNGIYVTMKHRAALVASRNLRLRLAHDKWKRAIRIALFFRWIPSVSLVGVTGGLSMDNAEAEDDIDLFFITQRGTLWISRFFVTVYAHILGVRRSPNDASVADKVCLNMFMTDDCLGLRQSEQDLFAAHEILQMRPLWQRNGVYRKFLYANRWVKYFLPNAWEERYHGVGSTYHGKNTYAFAALNRNPFIIILRLIEPLARMSQLWYMQKRRTQEVIEPGVLRFHPKDARTWVRSKYEKRLKKLNLPLDKFFYHR